MVKEIRKPHTIKFSDNEWQRIKTVADNSGENASGYIRRQILIIIKEKESQE